MISAISSQGSVRFMVYQDAMNQQRLIRFMERLMRTSEQKVFLIADYSIIPPLFPVSSSNLYFPIFARISNN